MTVLLLTAMAIPAVAAAAASAAPAGGDPGVSVAASACTEVFANYGPGDLVTGGASWGIGEHPLEDPYVRAMSFTVPEGSDFFLESLALTAFAYDATPTGLVVTLTEDSGGFPKPALESFTFPDLALWSPALSPLAATSVARPLLAGGATYWLTAEVGDPEATAAGWALNDQGVVGLAGWHSGDAPWSFALAALGAFRVRGCAATRVFADGFETGDDAPWGEAVP